MKHRRSGTLADSIIVEISAYRPIWNDGKTVYMEWTMQMLGHTGYIHVYEYKKKQNLESEFWGLYEPQND
jgi:hypothetical protein